MLIDGKAIAHDVEESVRVALNNITKVPTLAIVVVGEDPVIASFVRIKKRMAERLKIPVVERYFSDTTTGEELVKQVTAIGDDAHIDGIIIQLPLPAHIDAQQILNAVPLTKDIDMLSTRAVAEFAQGDAIILPPVAGAIQEILERNKIAVDGREALVLGYGKLVGVPASILLRHNHAHVTVIDREVADFAQHVRESAIIISGVGKPGLIKFDMISPGTVIIDAGTSESGGRVVGDADPRCAEVAHMMTPVPGGVGPVTVAMIFKNLCVLARAKELQRSEI